MLENVPALDAVEVAVCVCFQNQTVVGRVGSGRVMTREKPRWLL